jgi:succinate dehydrogenase / fumarate reductase flavoprotein subunit
MQGLADGYFIVPATVGAYLAASRLAPIPEDQADVRGARADVAARIDGLLQRRGHRTATDFHRALGRVLWDACGLERSGAGLSKAIDEIAALREAFAEDATVPGGGAELNQELERAGRVADFLELGELMCRDALSREESCGCHFRVEHQTADGEARRNDASFAHVAAWLPGVEGRAPERLVEPLEFAAMIPGERSYR